MNGEALPIWFPADINNECCVEVDPVIWLLLVGRSTLVGSAVTYFMHFLGAELVGSLLSPDSLRFDIVAHGGHKGKTLLRAVDVIEKKRKRSNEGVVFREQNPGQAAEAIAAEHGYIGLFGPQE